MQIARVRLSNEASRLPTASVLGLLSSGRAQKCPVKSAGADKSCLVALFYCRRGAAHEACNR